MHAPSISHDLSFCAGVLSDFRNRREVDRPRADYTECLAQDFADYYGYNRELVDVFTQLFSPAEAVQFFEANEAPRPVTLRVNTLKTRRRELAQALVNRGVNLDPLGSWTKVRRRSACVFCHFPPRMMKIYDDLCEVGLRPYLC